MTNFFSKSGTLFAILALTSPAILHAARLNAPLWDVYVVDSTGHPLAGITVRESYQDYSCEAESHMESLITDSKGHVQFQAHYEKRNPFRCAEETTSSLGTGVHASLGRHADVSVGGYHEALTGYAVDGTDHVIDWTGSPRQMVSTIVARTKDEWKRRIEEEKPSQSARPD